ncbi:hypothetical protein MANES_03G041016v8 [Manihot esculenta]|uniref:Uncharacterized protein n=1 Tax=Manihot esculenta TaxID=3983 RepID=A0ACC8DUW4_MANES|nr:hypothetical protein MANES_03G041016v8 [Manihot esculenta]
MPASSRVLHSLSEYVASHPILPHRVSLSLLLFFKHVASHPTSPHHVSLSLLLFSFIYGISPNHRSPSPFSPLSQHAMPCPSLPHRVSLFSLLLFFSLLVFLQPTTVFLLFLFLSSVAAVMVLGDKFHYCCVIFSFFQIIASGNSKSMATRIYDPKQGSWVKSLMSCKSTPESKKANQRCVSSNSKL